MEPEATDKDSSTPSTFSGRIVSYAIVIIPFALAMTTSALLVAHSLLTYVLLISAFCAGFVIAPLLLASFSKTDKQRSLLHRFIACLPGSIYISDRIEAMQESIDLLEARHQTLTDNLAAAIIIRDAEGEILYCSPYIEVLTGYSQTEIYADSEGFFSTIVHEDDRDKVDRSLKVSQLGEAFQFRYRFYHKTGLLMWAETRTVPLLDEQEQLQALLSITFDVTGSMRYQQRVEEHNQDLRDFSYMLSHDLKSPMVTIRGMLNALREDHTAELSPDALSLISHAEQASERLQSLIAGVIEYSRISNLEEQPQPVDCTLLLQEVSQELQFALSQAQGEITTRSLPTVWGDHTMLYQVFLNLIGNAIKYRSNDRPLCITIDATNHSDERTTIITFSDTGRGIPADRIEHIFRPFHRAHGTDIEGSGIGLACVKKLLDRMGGSIDVASQLEKGTTFSLQLRLVDTPQRD